MISMVYRRKRTKKNGKIESARLYRGRYRLDGDTKIADIALHTSDKRVAQQALEKIVQQKQLEAAGLAPSENQKNAAQMTIQEHLKNYLVDVTTRGREPKYLETLRYTIQKVVKGCDWKVMADVTADSFITWRANQQKAPKTLKEYLVATSGLFNWMERQERIDKNPLRRVQRVQTAGKQTFIRRAFTDDEMQRLLAIAGPRKIVYLMAVYTGLRRGELGKLVASDIHLDVAQPFMTVRASITKNHCQANIPLHPDLHKDLSTIVRERPSPGKLLDHLIPSMYQFRRDLVAAKIDFVNADGKRADFHSLRYTLATNMARAGINPRLAMEVMRHHDIKLTTKTYTDAGLLPVADAVLTLPSLESRTQIGTHHLIRHRADPSNPVTKMSKQKRLQSTEHQKVMVLSANPDQTSHDFHESEKNRSQTVWQDGRRPGSHCKALAGCKEAAIRPLPTELFTC